MIIDIFTHIIPPKYKVALGKVLEGPLAAHLDRQLARVPTLGDLEQRFSILDRYPDVRQVLTISKSGVSILEDDRLAVDCARRVNDEIAELVERYPERFFAGVASLPLTGMNETLKELDRALGTLRLKGIQLLTPNIKGPWDLEEMRPLFEKMCAYDLPIWVHPAYPLDLTDYEKFFQAHVFGWPYQSVALMTRLVFGRVLEDFPSLKIITHHCGAAVPFFDQRIVEAYGAASAIFGIEYKGALSRHPVEYYKMFYADTALSGGTSGLNCGRDFFGVDHLVFGTDMPYDAEFGERMIKLTTEAVEKMPISDSEKKMIFEGNARKLLKVDN